MSKSLKIGFDPAFGDDSPFIVMKEEDMPDVGSVKVEFKAIESVGSGMANPLIRELLGGMLHKKTVEAHLPHGQFVRRVITVPYGMTDAEAHAVAFPECVEEFFNIETPQALRL